MLFHRHTIICLELSDDLLLNFVAMLRVSGLDLNQSDHSDQVKKLLKYVADISRKIEERHQVC